MEDEILRSIPVSSDAEKAVLSCCLKSPEEIIPETIESMVPEFFYIPAHRTIYETLLRLWESSQLGEMDLVVLIEALRTSEQLDQVGGAAAVSELLYDVPSVKMFPHYRNILREKYILRQIIKECSDYQSTAYESENADELLADVESIGEDIRRTVEFGTELPSLKETAVHQLGKLEDLYEAQRRHGGVLIGLPSGFSALDQITMGFQPGRVYVFAARPKQGKTALLRQIIFEAAQSTPVLFHSLEMSRADIVTSWFGQIEKVNLNKISSGAIDQEEWDRVVNAAHRLSQLPIWIDDRMLTARQIVASARKWKRKESVGLVAIDYVQLVIADGRFERENEVIKIQNASSQFVRLAKNLNVPVIVLAQLNRDAEGKVARDLHMGYLKGAGALEQDAAFIGLLGESGEKNEDPTIQSKMLKTMGRFSHRTVIPLTFYPHYTRFEEMKDQESE